VRRCVWSRNLTNEAAWAPVGLFHHRKKNTSKEWAGNTKGKVLRGESWSAGRKTVTSTNLSTTNPVYYYDTVLINTTLLQYDVSESASASLYTKGGNPIPVGPIGTPKLFWSGSWPFQSAAVGENLITGKTALLKTAIRHQKSGRQCFESRGRRVRGSTTERKRACAQTPYMFSSWFAKIWHVTQVSLS